MIPLCHKPSWRRSNYFQHIYQRPQSSLGQCIPARITIGSNIIRSLSSTLTCMDFPACIFITEMAASTCAAPSSFWRTARISALVHFQVDGTAGGNRPGLRKIGYLRFGILNTKKIERNRRSSFCFFETYFIYFQ